MEIRNLIQSLTPPIVLNQLDRIIKKYNSHINDNTVYWSGNYASWEEASKISSGYGEQKILDKVKEAILKVKNKEAVYKRDSVIFDHVQYSWPLLSNLLKHAIGVQSLPSLLSMRLIADSAGS